MTRRPKPAGLIVVSDLHCGSLVGLCPPTVPLEDGHYTASAAQRWLWSCWNEFIKASIKRTEGRVRFVVLNGDLVDGQPHGSQQVISPSAAIQADIARECLAPLVEVADHLFVMRGTSAHVGALAAQEEVLAAEWQAEATTSGTHSRYGLRAEVGGVLVDIAHHWSGGGRTATRGNAALALARDAIMWHASNGERVPRLVMRSHLHTYHDSGDNYPSTRAIITPAWQLATEYAHRLGARPASVGGIVALCNSGTLEEVAAHLFQPRLEAIWRARD